MQLKPQIEIFALPFKEEYLIYAPLVGRVVHANSECVAQIKRYLETSDPSVVGEDIQRALGGLVWLTGANPPLPLPVDRQFHPTTVTLFVTNRCNLRCRYCYASAGHYEGHDMPAPVYRAAIDLVTRNAKRAGHPAWVGFHGGGEPSTAWPTLVDAVEYARCAASRDGITGVRFGIATNGVMPRDHAVFVAKTFPVVTLSFDGPADIQDAQRPHVDGHGSFDDVMAFIGVLREHNTPFVIRATITAANVRRMPEMVDFFATHTACRQLHFEPAFSSGRCCGDMAQLASYDQFSESFIAAADTARKHKVQLRLSAVRLMGAFMSFCGCSQDAFNVTHNGDVTACFEVCEECQPLADTFFFGKYDVSSGGFRIDYDRLAFLRSLHVYNNPVCAKCFAKWNCAGDCPVKGNTGSDAQGETPRCHMIQTVTRAMLERSLTVETT